MTAWPSAAGASAVCSGRWRSCAPSSVARVWSATARRAPSKSQARHRRRRVRARPPDLGSAIEQQFTPILRAFARAVGQAEQLLFALRRRADDHQDALFGVFKTGLQVNAVGPHVDVALGRQIALPPMLVLVEPDLLQPRDGRGRQARRILAEQRSKRLLEIAGRDALQVKDWDQHLQAAGAPRIGRQDSRREADAPGIILGSTTVAHARLAHADRADAGHYLAFG